MVTYRRPQRIALLLAMVLLGGGCGGAFVERVAGWYIARKIDGIFDLESEQHDWVRDRVDHHLDSMRKGELDRAIALLEDTRDLMAKGPSDAEIKAMQDRSDALMDRFVRRMAPDAAHLLAGLSDGQVDHFKGEMLDALEDSYEDVRLSKQERRQRADEKFIERMEDILGKVRDDQRAEWLPIARRIADERPRQYASGKERINDVASKLRAHPPEAEIHAGMIDMWEKRYAAIGPKTREQRRAEQRAFLLRIDRSLDAEQRAHAVAEMDSRIAQLSRFRAR